VKVRGFRIELGEIESALNGHALVKDRVVMVRSDGPGREAPGLLPGATRHAGQHGPRCPGAPSSPPVRGHLRERLPEHMIPTAFVVMSAFPLTPNGKVDKKALASAGAAHTDPARALCWRRAITWKGSWQAIWGQRLNVPRLGVHDNFFEIGGHSLIGIQILEQVEQQLGRPVSLQALFQAPTIAEFARLLQAGGTQVAWTNLSPIQPDGHKAPFFCVHGDEANYFLPRYLGSDQPFYAFFHQGDDGSPIRWTGVEEIAAHFIEELRSVRSRGPYLLGGYSFGGIVAFEMAQQLSAAGEEVPLLALFDTYDPLEYALDMQREARFYDPLKHAVFGALAHSSLKRKGHIANPRIRHHYIIETYDRAIKAYKPRPYAGMITVFKAESTSGPDHMGWQHLAQVAST
jgi:thioesterase domain-containing protein